MNNKILIIDDDKDLSMIIDDTLSSYGYDVTCAYNSSQAYDLLSDNIFSLVLLDINLPDSDGFEVCRQIRKISQVPIIFASARTNEDDKTNGLDIGGDDYIAKPYSLKELVSRVNALLRRTYKNDDKNQTVKFSDIEINLLSRKVYKKGKEVMLSLREFDLLAFLYNNLNKAVSKDKLISGVWGAFSEVEPSTLTVHIRWLREKLENNPAKPELIKTVWGIGYMLEVKDEN